MDIGICVFLKSDFLAVVYMPDPHPQVLALVAAGSLNSTERCCHTNTLQLLVEPELLGKTFQKFPVAATNCSGLHCSTAVTCLSPSQGSQLLKLETPPWTPTSSASRGHEEDCKCLQFLMKYGGSGQ
jgi:hypothetical protein